MENLFSSGISGLEAYQNMLDVVGNNLANLDTSGFKSQTIQFADLLYQTSKAATGGNSSGGTSSGSGGTNPVQIGSGVSAGSIETNLSQGTITNSGNALDLAIQGNGFFVVNNGTQDLYTRAGSFSVNQNGFLVDSASGDMAQRTGTTGEGSATTPAFQTPGNNNIQIAYGGAIPAQATSQMAISGNLSAAATGPLAETLTSRQAFTTSGAAAQSNTLLNNLDGISTPYQTGDEIGISGEDSNGTAVNQTFGVGAATTLGDLVNAINSDFGHSTASLDSKGNLILEANQTGPAPLSLTLSDASSNVGASNWSDHALAETVTGKNGDEVNTGIDVYDSEGTAHNVALTFQKQSNGSWDLTAAIKPTDGTVVSGTVTGIQFNDNGSFRELNGANPGNGTLVFDFNGLSAPQSIALTFGAPNGFEGLTQVGGASSASASGQNGFAAGFLDSVAVTSDGTIQGVFSNGQTIALAQLALASFSNPQGLNREGNNYLSATPSSGLALIGPAQSQGLGSIQGGALESSNVNVSQELTNLIIAQRGYQVNARTVSAENDLLQYLANLGTQ
jgi:flagellar hook protein FlgE